MPSIVVVGSYNQDFVWRVAKLPAPGETQLGIFSTGPGGKGFNQAVAAHRMHDGVVFVGARGDDAPGEEAVRTAQRFGLESIWQITTAAATGTAAVLVDKRSQNLIAVAPGANAQLAPEFIAQHAALIEAARVLLVQCEVQPSASARALALARSAGVCTVFNPAPVHLDLISELLDLADILTPNESEFSSLLLATRSTSVMVNSLAQLDDASLHALCRKLHHSTVVLTLGASGAFVSHAEDGLRGDVLACYRVAAELANPIDTTGAGDAFNGGLAAALAASTAHTPFEHSVRHAGRVAALSVEKAGAANAMPSRQELVDRFGL
ncbi:MAG: ribokinase [Pseudomonadota bacterium]|mgnify:CR=1 FL=1|nr:ribokinase [Pseudomonadota bacterium]